MKRYLFIPLLFVLLSGYSQTKGANVQLMNPSSLSVPKGYSQAAIIDVGNCKMIILSGQVAIDKNGNLIGKDTIERQAEQVFLNIKNAVEELGGTMDNIVKLGYYVTDITQIKAIRTVRDRFINTMHPPASTLVQVNKLFRDDVMLEVDATAVIPINRK